jgi:hypothetical protein
MIFLVFRAVMLPRGLQSELGTWPAYAVDMKRGF